MKKSISIPILFSILLIGCGQNDSVTWFENETKDQTKNSSTDSEIQSTLPILTNTTTKTSSAVSETTEHSMSESTINEQQKCGDDAFWSFDKQSGIMTISGTGTTYDYGDPFYGETASPWFDYNDQIREIVIEEGITGTGDYNFCFSSVAKVSFPSSIRIIKGFQSCENLKEVTIPKDVTDLSQSGLGLTGNSGTGVVNGFTLYGYSGTVAEQYVQQINSTPGMDAPLTFVSQNQSAPSQPTNNKTYFDYFGGYLSNTETRIYVDGSNVDASISQYALIDLDQDGEKELLVDYDCHAGQVGLYEQCLKVDGMIVAEGEIYSTSRWTGVFQAADGNGLIIDKYFPTAGPYTCGRLQPLINVYEELSQCTEDSAPAYERFIAETAKYKGTEVQFYLPTQLDALYEQAPASFMW